jgi:CheY-like chemotaxis protein
MAEPASPPLVLVIDDAEDTRSGLAEFLELSGFRAATARNGYESLARVIELKPDIILMDLRNAGDGRRRGSTRAEA